MKYSLIVSLYDSLGATTKRLEKAQILAEFFKKHAKEEKHFDWTYLLFGRVYPEYDTRETGISRQLTLKAIASCFGIAEEKVDSLFDKEGDLGEVAEHYAQNRNQGALFSKVLSSEQVIESMRNISQMEGKGAVERKIELIKGLYSNATPREALYITRTLVGDLRIGVASALVLDALAVAFFENDKETRLLIEEKYLLCNDIARIVSIRNKKEIEQISLSIGIPTQVMLAPKVADIDEAFESCGRPCAFEHKYDGFRVVIHKQKENVFLFTRKLENVTNQFPDVVEVVKKYIKGESFILDSEVVGFDPKTKKYRPFEAISQRIRRKYDIEELKDKLPVEVNVFDVLYYEGESMIDKPFTERRKLVEKIIDEKKLVVRPAFQIITDDEKEAEKFYQEALGIGEEGVMIKRLDAPYRFGRYVGYMAKLKPVANDLDLVIVGAEHGTGKRGGWLTSYIVACREGDKFVEVGRVSSGLKEKEEEGFTFEEMTNLIKPLITSEKEGIVSVKPKIVVAVTYQNMQPSTSYSSGYALRFPRITSYRPDRNTSDIATLSDIKKLVKEQIK